MPVTPPKRGNESLKKINKTMTITEENVGNNI